MTKIAIPTFRKHRKEPVVSSATTYEHVKFVCQFSTCGVVFNTVSQLKTHLFHHHKTAKKDCVYSGCSYTASNRFTLKVLKFIHSGAGYVF
jgi:hypothetical protein